MSTIEAIVALAADFEAALQRSDGTEAALVEKAAECLAHPLDLDFSSLARAICDGASLPEQRRADQAFGEPTLTLYRNDHFLIEANCWHTGTPAIHQHAFCGAFRVLTGRSVHGRYSFTESERVEGLRLGDLCLQSVELLDRRDVVRIPRGSGLIHSAFHLDSPSMTLVIRTPQGPEPEPTYLPPGVSYDTAARSDELHKRLQLLDTLNRTGHPAYVDCLRSAVERASPYDGMACLMRAASHRLDDGTFLSLVELLARRHGPPMHHVGRALIEERRRIALIRLRSTVSDPGSRFFLACLLSFFERRSLLDAMERHWGDRERARAEVARGVSELVGGDDDRRVVTTTAARAWIEGVSPAAFPGWAAEAWGRRLTDAERGRLSTFYERLQDHPLLRPLVERGGDEISGGGHSTP